MMTRLILLNGPPASGKSTLAARFVALHPLSLNLDIDVVRSLLGSWIDQPNERGLIARSMAIEMARVQLLAGRTVIVPQYLARPDFIFELEALATQSSAEFVEVALLASKTDAASWFSERSSSSQLAVHQDARKLLERNGELDGLDAMYDGFVRTLAQRLATRQVHVVRGDIDQTYELLESALRTKT